eukprot:1269212-Prymnesium_polylepis.1
MDVRNELLEFTRPPPSREQRTPPGRDSRALAHGRAARCRRDGQTPAARRLAGGQSERVNLLPFRDPQQRRHVAVDQV